MRGPGNNPRTLKSRTSGQHRRRLSGERFAKAPHLKGCVEVLMRSVRIGLYFFFFWRERLSGQRELS